MNNQLVELTYAKWCGHYSSKNWIKQWPLWEQLSEESQKWWTEFVIGIRAGFKVGVVEEPQPANVHIVEKKKTIENPK